MRFAERLLALLNATRYSATCKLAALLALIDVIAEHTSTDGTAPGAISAKDAPPAYTSKPLRLFKAG